jgi:hypothetical protein
MNKYYQQIIPQKKYFQQISIFFKKTEVKQTIGPSFCLHPMN